MQEDQKLMVEFQDYPNVLIRMLNNCIKEPHSHLAVFVMQHDVNARLDFIQVGRGSERLYRCSSTTSILDGGVIDVLILGLASAYGTAVGLSIGPTRTPSFRRYCY